MTFMKTQAGAGKRTLLTIVGIILVLLILGGIWAWPTLRNLATLLPTNEKKQGWTPDTLKNLNALYTGMMLQHESDGQFPKSDQWMDKIIIRVRTETLKKGAEKEKFVDPAAGGQAGAYGFAMNDAASEKYKEDLKDKNMPLIFQSTDTSWNAHGDPAKIGRNGGIGIAIDGSEVKL
jgi:hypothetical protein